METVSEGGEMLDRPNILPLDCPFPGNNHLEDPGSSVVETDSTSKRRRSRAEQFYRKLSQVPDGCSSPESNFQEEQRSIAEELYLSATERCRGRTCSYSGYSLLDQIAILLYFVMEEQSTTS